MIYYFYCVFTILGISPFITLNHVKHLHCSKLFSYSCLITNVINLVHYFISGFLSPFKRKKKKNPSRLFTDLYSQKNKITVELWRFSSFKTGKVFHHMVEHAFNHLTVFLVSTMPIQIELAALQFLIYLFSSYTFNRLILNQKCRFLTSS